MMREENAMSLEELAVNLQEAVEERLGITVRISETVKNNGVKLTGMAFISKEHKVSPLAYLEQFYPYYMEHGFESTVEKMINFYEEGVSSFAVDMREVVEYERAKYRLRLKLVNYEQNKEQLKVVPFCRYMDLAVVVYIDLEDFGGAIIAVHNGILNCWGQSESTLFQDALSNMQDECLLEPIECFLTDMAGLGIESGLYVLTNKQQRYGASMLLVKDELKKFAERMGVKQIGMIPASVHEWILIAENEPVDDEEVERYKAILHEINNTELLTEDILSYNVYLYDLEEDMITVR